MQELEASFEDISYLNPELRSILANHDKLHEEVGLGPPTEPDLTQTPSRQVENQTVYFDRILGIIMDLYIDKHKMMGQNVKGRAKELLVLLHDADCTLEALQEFFNSK